MDCRKTGCGASPCGMGFPCGAAPCGERSHCGACCGGACHQNGLTLTEGELALLRLFGALAFLPVAASPKEDRPVCLEEGVEPEEMGPAILGLRQKGLICVDYDIPLVNFGYGGYEEYPMHGSMALTASGQRAVESLDIQGVEP